MIEAYAFLAAFAILILVVSVLLPTWFIKYVRVQTTRLPPERLAQLYPGVDLARAQARFVTQYRTLTTSIALLALLLLGWLFNYVRRPDWDEGTVSALATVYFLAAHMLPLLLFAWVGVKFNKEHKRSLPDGKRTAILQRRGVFDFVSPCSVFLAALSYFLFAAFVIYIRQHPFTGFAGLISLGAITLVYALNAFVVYTVIYGGSKNPFETHAARLNTIALTVKSSVYSCTVIVAYLSLNFSLRLLDQKKWEPFALSVFFVICALVASMGFAAPLRKPEVDELDSHEGLTR
jgi:hypothetical protein